MIIRKTAFCSNKTCCPVIEINTDTAIANIVDDYGNVATLLVDKLLAANSPESIGLEGVLPEQWNILLDTARGAYV